jgi:hypothetical protein
MSNQIEKNLDNDLGAENSSSVEKPGSDLAKKPAAKGAAKKSAPKTAVKPASTDLSPKKSNEFTIDPITGEKYLKPKGDSVSLGQRAFKIPSIRREGYIIIWPVTRPNEIQSLLDQGWDFVDPSTPGCEKAATKVYAGTDKQGNPLYHRALQMGLESYQNLMNARDRENDRREFEMIYNPGQKLDKDFYFSKEHKRAYHNYSTEDTGPARKPVMSSGMDNSMAHGFNNAMR